MNAIRGLRWSSAWFAVPIAGLAAYVAGVSEKEFFGDYPLIGVSQAWIGLVIVAPLIAAWCSWDASRLRTWLLLHFSGVQQLKALAVMLGAGFALAVAAVLAATGWAAGLPRTVPAISITVAGVLTLMAAALTGAALGVLVPRVVAAPLSAGIWYAWMAIPMSDPSHWTAAATVTGASATCCTSSQEVNPASMLTASAVALICGAAALISIWVASRARGAAVLIAGVALAGSAGWALTHIQDGPIVARTTQLSCAQDGPGRVCIWPEHHGQEARINAAIQAVRSRLQHEVIPVPQSWSEAPTRPPGVGNLQWTTGVSPEQARSSIVVSVVQTAGCHDARGEALTSFLRLQVGVSPEANGTPASSAQARQVQGLPAAQRTAWVKQQITACSA
ncbi:DUF7224 domain-containing protein [Luteipulveratus halotolerans]|uniref:DUF7224 domain-containing protein n=1 Tax=Luteipulveratus halotolerans TaxID=1631356 RepID=A0A0L6CEI4_9MICO|nr:hypothetical protein [Luteipulveratus halotolerans]KNX35918.1 hypothetical protein VV01_21930 [Luteipulveratus halotolerans]